MEQMEKTFDLLMLLIDRSVNNQYTEFQRLCWQYAAYYLKQWYQYSREYNGYQPNHKLAVEYLAKFNNELKCLGENLEHYNKWFE